MYLVKDRNQHLPQFVIATRKRKIVYKLDCIFCVCKYLYHDLFWNVWSLFVYVQTILHYNTRWTDIYVVMTDENIASSAFIASHNVLKVCASRRQELRKI